MNTAIIKPEWSFITIALMVVGFMLFWPLGLAMLGYIMWGERFGGSADKAERWVSKQKKCWGGSRRHRRQRHASGNAAFDNYREDQLNRLDEERRKLDEDVNKFHDYVQNLRMARDREEFDRYMRNRGDNHDSSRQGYDADEDDCKKDNRDD